MYEDVKGMIWEITFMFSKGQGESVNWEKYASIPDEVNRLGCEMEAHRKVNKPECRYVGHIAAMVEGIRNIKTNRGHALSVEHDPSQGQGRHHAEVRIVTSSTSSSLAKSDRAELRFALSKAFQELVRYSCGG